MTDYTINPTIKFCKRVIDLVVATILLIAFAPLLLIFALIVKMDSSGPVLFTQQRIGFSNELFVEFFTIYKLRTMVIDAEKHRGAVLATANDARITKIGHFLRKSRLDELPQLYNVLRGDMSLIGPRPERPEFYLQLENDIPFFAERTFLVQPGITGLAQVNQGYDTCLEDVRTKVGYDHRYALALFCPLDWIMMDIHIAMKTIIVMTAGRGY
ncbi:MAG: sugar transferase [Gammaproteobacteria bacterium]|nr:sugar transferase [Gammaproteobacteria bacterium]